MLWIRGKRGDYWSLSEGVHCDVERDGRAWCWSAAKLTDDGGEIVFRGKATHLALAKGAAEAAVPRIAAAYKTLTRP